MNCRFLSHCIISNAFNKTNYHITYFSPSEKQKLLTLVMNFQQNNSFPVNVFHNLIVESAEAEMTRLLSTRITR